MPGDVLVLNRNFFAIEVASWERAMALLYLGRASVIDEEYNAHDFETWVQLSQAITEHPSGFIHTPTLKVAIPEVIALKFFDKVPKVEVPFTRRNIYEHYGHHCCYCGKRFTASELNLDHVVPRSRGGSTDWSNIVTACIPCNLHKGCRLPCEARMKLRVPITKPKYEASVMHMWRLPNC